MSHITLQHVAVKAGVAKSTACEVLRNRASKVKISDATRERVLAAAKELDYEPLAAASALSTGKTFNIGFMISTKITMGLANYYFSSIMAGVERTCQERGYNCIIAAHDLSTTKSFVTPSKIRSRKVDGVIICGYVEDEIVQIFVDSDIPFVLVGESTEFSREGILSVAEDMVQTWIRTFEYVHSLGHRLISVGGTISQRARSILDKAIVNFNAASNADPLTVRCCPNEVGHDSFAFAFEEGLKWSEKSERTTALIGHAYWCVGFLGALIDSGYQCPRDISIISTTDSPLCKWYRPAITAYATPVFENGRSVANLLIDYIEKKSIYEAYRRAATIWKQGELIIRSSCRDISHV